MSSTPGLENTLVPVTALAFLNFYRVYLIAGEGQYLKVFEHRTGTLLSNHRVFNSETIHGISCSTNKDEEPPSSAKVLLWGGRSVCLAELSSKKSTTAAQLSLYIVLPEIRTGDWILDGCIRPFITESDIRYSVPFEAVLVTAHNELQRLRFPLKSLVKIRDDPLIKVPALHSIKCLGSGPKSMLYSAHIRWSRDDHAEGRILVAAGTVFGEVHLWSSDYDQIWDFKGGQRHCIFSGHLGSVFGVRISEEVSLSNGLTTRLLASCSDDRTIRVWRISGLRTPLSVERSSRCLATIMGHASRIWGVRFLYGQKGIPQLLSSGEDGTAQAWFLEQIPEEQQTGKMDIDGLFKLVHDTKYHYHSGKHIWAAATLEEGDGSSQIATGGSDGRIVSYRKVPPNWTASNGAVSCQRTMSQIIKTSEDIDESAKAITKKALFDALKGHWRLSRRLQSAIPTYPSGTLTGIARFEERPITDRAFNNEYLYSEEGDFVMDKGFTTKATRQYVYRYQQNVDKLTAWFVKTDGHSTVDYFFHSLDFTEEKEELPKRSPERKESILIARGHHLCINDNYTAEYTFTFTGRLMKEWSLKYSVKGPQKDYVANARYSRFLPDDEWVGVEVSPKESSEANGKMDCEPAKADVVKNYAWLSNNEFLTTTEQGNVLIGTINPDCSADESNTDFPTLSWKPVGYISDLKSSTVVTSIPSLGVAFLVGANGYVFRYYHRTKTVEFAMLRQQKPAYVKSQEIYADVASKGDDKYGSWGEVFDFGDLSHCRRWISLVTTALASDNVIISLHPFDVHKASGDCYSRVFKLPQGFIVTSSCLLEKATLAILGSRNGDLLIYDPLRKLCKARTSSSESIFSGVHGREAITAIQVIPDRESLSTPGTSWILTVGRDGRFAVHQIHFFEMGRRKRNPGLKTYHESMPPFGPNIESAQFDSTNDDLFLWGFHSKQFIVWNETQKFEVMNIDCGGAHRHWAYSHLHNGRGGGRFVWTKASVCNVHMQTGTSHKVIKAGGHGREIKAIAVAPNREQCDSPGRRVIITGAEDTAIRVFEYEPRTGYRCVRIITKHTTGLQKLHWCGGHGQYLFSAAGCEEFYVWEIASVPCLGLGVTCRLECPTVTPDKDLRIMDFDVLDIRIAGPVLMEEDFAIHLLGMVYSDSSARIFAFRNVNSKEYSLTLLLEGSYATHCLTQVNFVHLNSEFWLCTASTDGNLAFWPLKNALSDHGFHISEGVSMFHNPDMRSKYPTKTFSWQKQIPIHQSSIKSFAQAQVSPKELLIVTGGDDQALALSIVSTQDSDSADKCLKNATLLLPNAHASAVTAVAFLGTKIIRTQMVYRFASVGNDQRLKIWEVFDNMRGEGVERFKMKRKANVHTSVADASALEAFTLRDDEPDRLCVAGIGMETWCVEGGLPTAEMK